MRLRLYTPVEDDGVQIDRGTNRPPPPTATAGSPGRRHHYGRSVVLCPPGQKPAAAGVGGWPGDAPDEHAATAYHATRFWRLLNAVPVGTGGLRLSAADVAEIARRRAKFERARGAGGPHPA